MATLLRLSLATLTFLVFFYSTTLLTSYSGLSPGMGAVSRSDARIDVFLYRKEIIMYQLFR